MKSLRFPLRICAGWGIALLAAAPVLIAGDETKNAANPAQDPFYRKYLVAGNPLDDEILSMEKKVEANPNDATLHNDFGNLLALRRFPEQAAEQYEMAAKLDKSNFIAYYNLGILREMEGKTSDAISAYQKSIARKPGFPQSRFRLGRLYEEENRLEAAVEQYAKALRIDPSMRDPKRNPLVIDSSLMYRASLANYERDVARVTLNRDVSFVEEPAFRHVRVDHPVSSEEVAADEAEAAPREVGPTGATGSSAGGSGSGTKRGSRTSTAPATGDVPMRPRPGSRPTPRATRPGQPAGPGGAGARMPPAEAAPTPPPEESPAEGNPNPNPGAAETAPEPAPTPAPEEIEPS